MKFITKEKKKLLKRVSESRNKSKTFFTGVEKGVGKNKTKIINNE